MEKNNNKPNCSSDKKHVINAIEKLYTLKKTNVKTGIYAAVFGTITALSIYSVTIPTPEVYIKSIVASEDNLDPPKDPKAVVKIKNNGGSLIVINKISLIKEGVSINSFEKLMPIEKKPDELTFKLSYESNHFLQYGGFQGKTAIVLATFRPNTNNESVKTKIINNIPRGSL